ncbi:MAG: replication initiator protein A [Firmicutes bacterium]|nr:replication initiator protein A [Bacillota bacterium]
MNDYFYGAQSCQFAFLRIPKVLFTDDRYKHVSAEAKVLYGILLDRMELSLRNGWIDDMGRVYIFCTAKEIMEKLNCADNKATKLMNELESKCGLIERKRQGLGKPNLIYVKNFIPSDIDTSAPRFKSRENHDSGPGETAIQESLKSRTINTDKNNTDSNYTDNHILSGCDEDGMGEYEKYKRLFRENLETDYLIGRFPGDEETLEGILDLLAETCCSGRKAIRVAGNDLPAVAVKERLMNLNSQHIEYILDCLKGNCANVKNMKQYLLASLFNAPVTINPYYQAKVNHDIYRDSREGGAG